MDTEYHIPSPPPRSPLRNNVVVEESRNQVREERDRTTEGSFHSAKEDQTTKVARQALENDAADANSTVPQTQPVAPQPTEQSEQTQEFDAHMDDIGSPSDESTPDRPLVRKGSLNFASLPAREPLKTSIGGRISRTSHVDQKKSLGPTRNSQSLHHAQILPQQASEVESEQGDEDDSEEDIVMDDSHIEILGHDDSEDEQQTVMQHTKSSTQRLHDKIEMLGKAPAPRPSKSIPSAMQMANRHSAAPRPSERAIEYPGLDDDDDWIKPLSSPKGKQAITQDQDEDTAGSDDDSQFDLRAPELIAHEERMRTPGRSPSPGKQRPGFGHAKSVSTATLASPAKMAMDMDRPVSPARSISVSHPQPTTTPNGSPRKYLDLSASKSKLQSIMKTAKGLFTSSAGVSAAAKLETLSPNALRMVSNTMPGMYPNMDKMLEDRPLPASPPKEGRKTRSSTEREKGDKRNQKDAKAMQKMDGQLEKARQHVAQKATQQKQQQEWARSETHSPKRGLEDESDAVEMNQQPKAGRLGKPAPVKGKPAPVSIRVGTHSQRMPMGSSIMNPNQETLPAEPKRPGLTKKASTSSLQSTTTIGFKASVHAQPTKPRALLAAERKREQDEQQAQRKLEQKREMERKRAAQQEEVRKQEARQRAEAERKERERIAAEQAKRQAQQQAIERKRQENARKVEQQRLERVAGERAAAENAAAARPPSRMGSTQPVPRSLINHPLPTNPAKPAKRPVEEDNVRPQASKYGAASQQQDSKRRRTDEEAAEPIRPTMSGAPIRQSNMKKPSIFNHAGYAPAPQPAHLSQFPQPPTRAQPPQMAQYANSKIPFADAPNPSGPAKTPLSAYQHKTIQAIKSSPHYQNGDQIHLPEIPTDSEDEDSEDEGNAFPIPDWATPGHLTNQLIAQEAIDGDAVFGPIAPLKMEEIFAKGNKERLKRLKDRTSSANWVKSGDALTLEEVRIDREQRERMRVEGGWRYGS